MTVVRRFDRKKRNAETRKQKPVILIVAEGKNVTEFQYFRSFQNQNANCTIRMIIAKHITDPEGMLKALQQKWNSFGLDSRKGDKAFVVLDLDCSDEKAELVAGLQNRSKEVQFIVSNPCFEVWFLLHFRYSTKQYYSSEAVVKDLKTIIPNYEKNLDISGKLAFLTDKAIENAEKLKRYYDKLGYRWPSNACNPRTDVDHVVSLINEALK